MILFPPEQVGNLYITESSSPIVEFSELSRCFREFPRFKIAWDSRVECMLQPGDVLHIPACWHHNITALDAPCISLNLFWRDPQVPVEQYPPRDVYGNKVRTLLCERQRIPVRLYVLELCCGNDHLYLVCLCVGFDRWKRLPSAERA